jgi:RNA-binding protein
MGNSLDTIVQIGKGGITDNVIKQVADALAAREIIKGRVLDASLLTARDAAEKLAEVCLAESVQTIGSRFVLYKENREIDKEKRIKLVK